MNQKQCKILIKICLEYKNLTSYSTFEYWSKNLKNSKFEIRNSNFEIWILKFEILVRIRLMWRYWNNIGTVLEVVATKLNKILFNVKNNIWTNNIWHMKCARTMCVLNKILPNLTYYISIRHTLCEQNICFTDYGAFLRSFSISAFFLSLLHHYFAFICVFFKFKKI